MAWFGATHELFGIAKSWTVGFAKFSVSVVTGEEGGRGIMLSVGRGFDVGISEGEVWTHESSFDVHKEYEQQHPVQRRGVEE